MTHSKSSRVDSEVWNNNLFMSLINIAELANSPIILKWGHTNGAI